WYSTQFSLDHGLVCELQVRSLLPGHGARVSTTFGGTVDFDGHPLVALGQISAYIVDHVVALRRVAHHAKVLEFALLRKVCDCRLSQLRQNLFQYRVSHSAPGFVRPDAPRTRVDGKFFQYVLSREQEKTNWLAPFFMCTFAAICRE